MISRWDQFLAEHVRVQTELFRALAAMALSHCEFSTRGIVTTPTCSGQGEMYHSTAISATAPNASPMFGVVPLRFICAHKSCSVPTLILGMMFIGLYLPGSQLMRWFAQVELVVSHWGTH